MVFHILYVILWILYQDILYFYPIIPDTRGKMSTVHLIYLLTTEKTIITELSFIPCVCSLPSMESWFMWKFSLFEELQGSSLPNITDEIIWNIKICCSLKNKIFLSSPVMRFDVAIFTVKRKTLSQMCFEWILDSQWKLLTAKMKYVIHSLLFVLSDF